MTEREGKGKGNIGISPRIKCGRARHNYTSLLFGRMVMGFFGPMYGQKFGALVFYLFGLLDSALGPSSFDTGF